MYVFPMVTALLGAGVFRLEEYLELSFSLQCVLCKNHFSRNLWQKD